MSLNSEEFTAVKIAIVNALNKSIRADTLNTRIQGYSLHEKVIFDEMIHTDSPFSWPDAAGNSLSRSEIIKLAKQVSKDLYAEYKKVALSRGAKPVKGNKLPPEFNNNKSIVMGYDDRKKIIFYAGTTRENFRSFTEQVVATVTKNIISTRAKTDPTRVLLEPNEEWLAIKNEFTSKIREGGGTKKSIEGKITRGLKNVRQESRERGILDYEGLQSGHTFGASVYAASSLNPVIHLIPEGKRPEIQSLVQRITEVDANLKLEKVFGPKGVKAEFTLLVPESATRNISSGGSTGDPLKQLRNILVKLLPDLKGSPSPKDLLIDQIESLFLNKKVKSGRTVVSTKVKTSAKTKIPINNIPVKRGKVKYSQSKADATEHSNPGSLQNLITLINSKLHDKIQENMGKGTSKAQLNYRTGRFARSAKVENLFPSKDKAAIEAQVKYMRYPYGVFEKGGRLYKPLRDPKGIFGRSIRQILQEEKIATLRRVKVDLRGQ